MGDSSSDQRIVKWRVCVALLDMLYNRECRCDRAKCAGHFEYLRRLKFEYECKIEEYEEEINRGDQSGISPVSYTHLTLPTICSV